jgi:hypothetical protein
VPSGSGSIESTPSRRTGSRSRESGQRPQTVRSGAPPAKGTRRSRGGALRRTGFPKMAPRRLIAGAADTTLRLDNAHMPTAATTAAALSGLGMTRERSGRASPIRIPVPVVPTMGCTSLGQARDLLFDDAVRAAPRPVNAITSEDSNLVRIIAHHPPGRSIHCQEVGVGFSRFVRRGFLFDQVLVNGANGTVENALGLPSRH